MTHGKILARLTILKYVELAQVATRCGVEDVSRRRSGTNQGEIYHNACSTEVDSHADTHCFGRNFRPIFWTGHECSVAPFLVEYLEQVNIPICTGAMAYTLVSGEVVILVFGQGLWFGNHMEKSLINPYQCRAYDIPLCDDPTDLHRSFEPPKKSINWYRMEVRCFFSLSIFAGKGKSRHD